MDPSDRWTPLYRAGWQGRKVAALWWLFLAATAAFAALALWADTPTDRATGLILGACLALASGGMEVYRRVYVVALDAAPGGRVRLRTAHVGRPRETEFTSGALTPGATHDGAWSTGGMSGAAPWTALRAPGRRLPFVLDLQGDVLDGAALARVTGQRWMADLEPPRGTGRR